MINNTWLIAVSYCEGFDQSLIEGAQHKLPIITRDIPVYWEMAGKHAYNSANWDLQGLAWSTKELLRLCENHDHSVSVSVQLPTWKESAEAVQRILLDSKVKSNPAQVKPIKMEEQ